MDPKRVFLKTREISTGLVERDFYTCHLSDVEFKIADHKLKIMKNLDHFKNKVKFSLQIKKNRKFGLVKNKMTFTLQIKKCSKFGQDHKL